MNLRKILAYLISLTVMMNLLSATTIAEEPVEPAFTIERSVSPSGEIFAGQEVEITYTLTPASFDVANPPQKEVALVIDVSGSMGGSRISSAKRVAKDFIDKLSSGKNVDVGLIKYSYRAENVKNGSNDFFEVDTTSGKDGIKGKIDNNLGTGGMTNIGDALRIAYHTLGGGNSSTEQYLVFLTDGDANQYTYHEAETATFEDYTGYIDYDTWIDWGLGTMTYSEWLNHYKSVIDWDGVNPHVYFDNVAADYSVSGESDVYLTGSYSFNEWKDNGYYLEGSRDFVKWYYWTEAYGLDFWSSEDLDKKVNVVNRFAYTEDVNTTVTTFTGDADYDEYIEKGIGSLDYEPEWIDYYWNDIDWDSINPKAYVTGVQKPSTSVHDAYYMGDVDDGGSIERSGHSYVDNGKTVNMSGLDYAKKVADLFDHSDTGINSYYISFKNGENNLDNISDETEGASFEYASDEAQLKKIYDRIAAQIIAPKSVNDIEFLESFPEGIEIIERPSGTIPSTDETRVYWELDELVYGLNASKTKYVADPQTFTMTVKAEDAGKYILGGGNEAYIKYTDPRFEDATTPTVLDMDEDILIIHKLNPPTINMSSELGIGSKSFTLSNNASGKMFLENGKDIQLKGAWQNDLFSSSGNAWSIYALLQPDVISNTSEHIFFSKTGDNGENLKVGIDSGKLLLGLKAADGSYVEKSIGSSTMLASETLNEVLISYEDGVVTTTVNGVSITNTFFDIPQGLGDSPNGSFEFGGSFEGSLNLVEFYDQAVTDTEIYDGTAADLVARYTPDDLDDQGDDDPSNDVLTDSSGTAGDKSSEPVGDVYIQQSASSASGSGDTRMEYKITKDGVEGSWTTYTGGTVLLRNTPGTATVEARTVLVADSDAKSDESNKAGSVKDPNYIGEVRITADPTEIELYSDLESLTKSEVTLTYELIGDVLTYGDQTAAQIDVDDIDFVIELDESAEAIVNDSDQVVGAEWLTYDDGAHELTGTMTGIKLDLVAGTTHDYKIHGDTITFEVGIIATGTSAPGDVNDIEIAGALGDGKTVAMSYVDIYGATKNKVDGNVVDVNVLPTAPIIDAVNGNDLVFVSLRDSVTITGKADPGAVVEITVTDDADSSKTVTKSGTADSNGDYSIPDFDLTDFKHDDPLNPFTVEAEVEDGDGDKNDSDSNANIVNIELDNEIL